MLSDKIYIEFYNGIDSLFKELQTSGDIDKFKEGVNNINRWYEEELEEIQCVLLPENDLKRCFCKKDYHNSCDCNGFVTQVDVFLRELDNKLRSIYIRMASDINIYILNVYIEKNKSCDSEIIKLYKILKKKNDKQNKTDKTDKTDNHNIMIYTYDTMG